MASDYLRILKNMPFDELTAELKAGIPQSRLSPQEYEELGSYLEEQMEKARRDEEYYRAEKEKHEKEIMRLAEQFSQVFSDD